MPPSSTDSPIEGDGILVSNQDAVDEKSAVTVLAGKDETKVSGDELSGEDDGNSEDVIIVNGADAARHLLPLRDDFDNALTFRSILLASGLACFQAVMNQIYMVTPEASSPISHGPADRSCPSLNQLLLTFREPLSSSSPIFAVMPGLNSSLVAINSRLGGGPEAARANSLGRLRSSSSSILDHGL